MKNNVNNKCLKVSILLNIFIFILCLTLNVNTVKASIIDDILKSFGVNNTVEETKETELREETSSASKELDKNEKEVVDKVNEIFRDIKNLDLQKLLKNIMYSINSNDVKNIEDFLNNYVDGKTNLKSIFSKINFKIENVESSGNKVVVKIRYTVPSIGNVIKKVLPELILKNAGSILSGNLTNDNINSIIDSVTKEMDKELYGKETYIREFTFEKENDSWKLSGIENMINEITNYIENNIMSILKK